MNEVWAYTLTSVFAISLISLLGLFTLALGKKSLDGVLMYMVSFAAGALVGGAFLHLLPEIVEEVGFTVQISLLVLFGVVSMFIIEKYIHWHHCHHCHENHKHHQIKPFALTNLIGDGVHNLMDGIIIGAAYLVAIPVGIATTIAVALHEIPQEIGDFGVLLHGGFTKAKALLWNFMSALLAVVGAVIALVAAGYVENITLFLVPIAAGHFIYIAMADLIPELHKENDKLKSVLELVFFVLGIAVMYGLLLLE